MNPNRLANGNAVAHVGPGADDATAADRGAISDIGMGADIHFGGELRVGLDDGARMPEGTARLVRLHRLQQKRQCVTRVLYYQ